MTPGIAKEASRQASPFVDSLRLIIFSVYASAEPNRPEAATPTCRRISLL